MAVKSALRKMRLRSDRSARSRAGTIRSGSGIAGRNRSKEARPLGRNRMNPRKPKTGNAGRSLWKASPLRKKKSARGSRVRRKGPFQRRRMGRKAAGLFNKGFNAGYNDGFNAGYARGFEEGFDAEYLSA